MKLRARTSPYPLEIRLFGSFQLSIDGNVRTKVPAAVQALLVLVILQARSPLSRQSLAAMLWPDGSNEQASFYLRRALSQLRALLADQSSRIGADLCVDLTDCRCDLAEFERLVRSEPSQAVASYTGSLVAGKRNHRFESLAQDLSERYLAALDRIADDREAAGDYAAAIRYLRQSLSEDRTREGSWRSLIRLLGLQRDHVGAARAFRQLRIALREVTGMEPTPETTAVYHGVMAQSDVLRVTPTQVAKPKFTNPRLPTPLTDLIGRDAEVQAIRDALKARRLVFVVGLGGVGKSRLAIEIVETWSPSASVSVARASDADELQAILATENLFRSDPASQAKRLLLIDNAEHLIEILQPAVERLLTDDPKLSILVTSRRSVTWPDAYIHHLDPFDVSIGPDISLAELSEVAAVKLFTERARSADPQFSLSSRNSAAVASICRKLDGIPLALELAAAKVQSLPITEIDRRLEDRFALLTRRGSGRTLETVLDWSYEELTETERELFLNLVQLPGSWSIEVCEAVSDNLDLESIDSLVALDLVTFQGGRYRCLQTVREYGLRTGKPSNGLARRLAEFYFAEVEARFTALEASMDEGAFDWFIQEESNLVWAIQQATRSSDRDHARQALVLYTHLHFFWIRTGRQATGYRLGVSLIEAEGEPSEELTGALFAVGSLAHHLSWLDIADDVLSRADSMSELLELGSWRAESLLRRAELLSGKSKLSESGTLLSEALKEFEKLGNAGKQATCLRSLGHVERELGRFPESIALTHRALKLCTELNDDAGRFWCIGSLGATWLAAGDPEQAATHFLENVEAARAIGDISTTIWNLTMLGEAQKEIGAYEKAAGSVREALMLRAHEQNLAALEWPISLLGELLTKLGDYAAADQALERAWQYHGQAGASKLGAYTMLRRADLHLRWGRLVSAKSFFEIAEEMIRESEVEDLAVQLELLRTALEAKRPA
jgi:predicted ATPase/DNA-binding SARP family transcriptional activator